MSEPCTEQLDEASNIGVTCPVDGQVHITRARQSVVLLQSTVGYDGRSRTLAFLIRLLNTRGIRPTLVTFSDEDGLEAMRSNAGFDLALDLVTVTRPRSVVGHHLEQLALPRIARRILDDYDVAYASDTSVYGYDARLVLIRLVCFPLEQVALYEYRYRRPLYRIYGAVTGAATAVARRGFDPHGRWIANSEFTKQAMLQAYSLDESDVTVVYPPVDLAALPAAGGTRERLVLSLGGFHEDKRQLEQIRIAAELPDISFAIVGSVRSDGYFERCRKAASLLGNVCLVPDASPADVVTLLGRARVFLHSKRFEHFGISTVEGIASGCVPVVHDSGGQRESVPVDDLRYRSLAGAVAAIRGAVEGRYDAHLVGLRRQAEAFGADAFDRRMGAVVDASFERVRT